MEELRILKLSPDVLWTILGGTGGAVKVFFQWTKKMPEEWKPAVLFLFLNVFISGFSGYLGATFAESISKDDHLHVIFAGIFGYLGVAGLDYLAEKIKK